MIIYKMTDDRDQTYGGCQWGEGITNSATGQGTVLCTDGWIHAYAHPLLAVLHDPIHGRFGSNAHLWECESSDEPLREGQMKLGVKTLTTLRRIPLPVVTLEQRVRYALLCARAGGADNVPGWTTWADGWLSGSDRSTAAARVVQAEWAARLVAVEAGEVWAAASRVGRSAEVATLAVAETEAARRVWAVAEVAALAARTMVDLDLIAMAEKAVAEEAAKP